MSDAQLLASLKKQRDGYAKDLQATMLSVQRLQGAITALDKAIADAANDHSDIADEDAAA